MNYLTSHATARMALWSAVYTQVLLEGLRSGNTVESMGFDPVKQADIAVFNFDETFSKVGNALSVTPIPEPRDLCE